MGGTRVTVHRVRRKEIKNGTENVREREIEKRGIGNVQVYNSGQKLRHLEM